MADDSSNGLLVEKAPVSEDAVNRTVQTVPPGQGPFYRDGLTGLFWIAQQADEMAAWGTNIKMRDMQLREFIPVEPLFNSALGIIAARNSAFSWKLEGPPRTTANMQRILQQADFGAGWATFLARVSVDLYTQDSGAFIEVIRAGNSETAELVGIAHLDAARCYPTGIAEAPVVYLDRMGDYHTLKWYQVVHLLELPATYEGIPGLQYSALTRMLRAVRIIRDIGIYLSEKVGGRNARSITAIRGVTPAQVAQAWDEAKAKADIGGLMRFMMPILVGSTDPKADIGFETLELASIPDGFDLETTNKWYISQIAMAFLEDYQTFAPLPGGGLGTSTQSEVLHAKSRGKGPALFQKIVAEAINWNILPKNVEFMWEQQDVEADIQEATAAGARATERKTRIDSGELTAQVARMRAHASGDLTQEELDYLATQDLADEATAQEFEPEEDILEEGAPQAAQQAPEGQPPEAIAQGGESAQSPGAIATQPQGSFKSARAYARERARREAWSRARYKARTAADDRSGPPKVAQARLDVEDDIAKVIEEAFVLARERLNRNVGQ